MQGLPMRTVIPPLRAVLFASALAAGTAASAHGGGAAAPAPAGERIDQLGRLDFPTSTGVPAAQTAFARGMLLLHLFEYPAARDAFQDAQRLDPGFALAYWGEAMTYTHPVWNQQDLEAARAALARLGPDPAARAARAPTAREKQWLHTVEVLYGEGDKRSRDAAFAEAMGALSRRYPKDDEARLFHALGLLGKAQGERDLPDFLEAARLSKRVFARNPEHPGAAHYWIHGMDDPAHAAGALEAARRLSEIAPAAPHAQHMTSHIFMALGQWDDVVRANERAEAVNAAQQAARGQPAYRCGHYSEWLEYGYFQQGREGEALQVLADCERQGPEVVAWLQAHPGSRVGATTSPEALRQRIAESLATLRAMAAIESPAYAREYAGRAPPRLQDPLADGTGWFARGLVQAGQGAADAAQASLATLLAIRDAEAAAPKGPEDSLATGRYLAVMAGMLEGAIARARGDLDAALAKLSAAAREYDAMPFDFGPPPTVKPPHELAGDLLLAANRPAEAAREYARALAWAPRRNLSARGLAKAQAAAAGRH